MTIADLARPEVRNLRPYQTAEQAAGVVRLNANELPWPPGNNGTGGELNRYPDIRPARLHAQLAAHYGVATGMVLATRGSSEAIDLLIRAFCRAGLDNIVTSSPTFAMYRVYADIQGAQTLDAPLLAERDFAFDAAAVLDRCTPSTKLIFVCSPNNPTGRLVPQSQLCELAEARTDRSLIVIDEAYAEFSGAPSATALLHRYENLVVLRTLSKALSLAGARCGAVIASEQLISLLDGILAPYALATPVIDCVLRSLSPDNLQVSSDAMQRVLGERKRVSDALALCPAVLKVWPSRSNFLLVKFHSLASVAARLRDSRILIRDFAHEPALQNCARITIGKPDENDLLLAALARISHTVAR
ncbi:MAG TPA: histidinol-phosphate transaminase [Woeseiaceae bacterium]|nr:histidinol-phosphate transaminase [Woeseiaceae bacterium]